jgi:hypothetical protein
MMSSSLFAHHHIGKESQRNRGHSNPETPSMIVVFLKGFFGLFRKSVELDRTSCYSEWRRYLRYVSTEFLTFRTLRMVCTHSCN